MIRLALIRQPFPASVYGIAFTIKMSYKGTHKIDGYFSYVVLQLEGTLLEKKTCKA